MKINVTNVKKNIKKHAPEILTGVGIVGVVGGGILACKATIDTTVVFENHKKTLEAVHKHYETLEEKTDVKKEKRKDVVDVYKHTALKVAKNYMPAVIVETISIGCLIGSHKILNKRNLTLAAAYTGLDESYKFYRNNVKETYGEEVDRRMLFGIKKEKIEIEETDPETGEVKTKKVTAEVVDTKMMEMYSDYTICFDSGSAFYRKDDPDANKFFVKKVMQQLNDQLVARGHLFWNEVLDAFGYPRTPLGAVAGWIYIPEEYGGNPIGDNCITCGLEKNFLNDADIHTQKKRDFLNGYEPAVLLDFNCDGLIFDKI